MEIRLELTGGTPLVMHNIRLADKADDFAKSIAEITSKRKKTPADEAEIERLEWYGGLYHDPDLGLYVPSWNVIRCLERAATITRQGTALVRALAVSSDKLALHYDGPRKLDELWSKPEFRWRTTVGVQRAKITRVRPIFRRWAVTLDAHLLDTVLSPDDFMRIAELAGTSEGLGDARRLGYGRFAASVAVAKAAA